MPRVSAEHEQAVRSRIVDAAINVFGEQGYTKASIQDVVRESGLSVGAVYTHFKSKEELFFVACACEAERETNELRLRLEELGSGRDRLRAAVDWSVSAIVAGVGPKSALAHAWMQADSSPELRPLLDERRQAMIEFARRLLDDAVADGSLPAWVDTQGVAGAFITMLDGLQAMSVGPVSVSPDEARRQAYALLDLLLAAPPQEPTPVAQLRAARR
jgi:AcrR family transcriptional regulator